MAKRQTVIREYLAKQLKALTKAVAGMESDAPDSVHAARVACRRMRSVIQSARPLWRAADRAALDEARAVLQAYGESLSEARDTEALIELVHQWAGEEEWDARSVSTVVRTLSRQSERVSTRTNALDHAGNEPVQRVRDVTADDVASAVNAVIKLPMSRKGRQPTPVALGMALSRASNRWFVLVAGAAGTVGSDDHVEMLHDVRKATKRLRYVAEVAKGHVNGAEDLVASCKQLQDIIGNIQDADVMNARLKNSRSQAASLVKAKADAYAAASKVSLPSVMVAASEACLATGKG